jgi:hypothetical protein
MRTNATSSATGSECVETCAGRLGATVRGLWIGFAIAAVCAPTTSHAQMSQGGLRIPPAREGECVITFLPNTHFDIACQAGKIGEMGNIGLKWSIPPDHSEYAKWRKLVGTRKCMIGLPVGIKC